MMRTVCVVCVGMLLLSGLVFAQETDPVQGNWARKLTQKQWQDKPVSAKVVASGKINEQGRPDATGKEGYRIILEVPSAGGKTTEIQVVGLVGKGCVEVKEKGMINGGEYNVSLKIAECKMKGKITGKGLPGAFEMAKVENKPPSLGAKPTAGAVVLFDGKNLDAWQPMATPWKILEDGSMEATKGNIVSKQEFGDHKIHAEFWLPLMASARGQARANSGVYVQGRYEVQVLDSYGLPVADNECGGIYKKAVPKVNACLPPTEWQTYDMTFHAPKFDDSGKKVKNATITVELNGIVIHDNIELNGTTPGGVSGDEAKAGPLLLQEHHNKVRYRNVWVQPLQ